VAAITPHVTHTANQFAKLSTFVFQPIMNYIFEEHEN